MVVGFRRGGRGARGGAGAGRHLAAAAHNDSSAAAAPVDDRQAVDTSRQPENYNGK